MPQNFSFQNLRGLSFEGQDLTGANFLHSDIRGADFSKAVLKGAKFSHAKAGLQNQKLGLLIIILFFISGIAGATSGASSIILARLFQSEYIEQHTAFPGVISYVTTVIFFTITLRRGFGLDLAISTGALTGILACFLPFLWLAFGFQGLEITNETGWKLAGAAAWGLAGFVTGTFSTATARIISQKSISVLEAAWIIGFTIVFFVSWLLRTPSGRWEFLFLVIIWGGIFAAVKAYISWQASAGNQKFIFIQRMAIAFAGIGGTSFREADLTNADFTQAALKCTDFRNANLTRTNFHRAKELVYARVSGTILNTPTVRDLVITHTGANQSYIGLNLKGANLSYADLNDADFTEANISEATFEGAWLERANLTKTQALTTNFQQSNLTGACIEAWNINNTTQLDNVICEFIYLLNNQQERRPHSGKFQLGEFTKLFQEVLDTVDLIFRNGIDWKAFATAFRHLQVENEGAELSIQGIEHKGDGVIVVKVDVPATTDKAKIHTEFTQNYELALKAIDEKYQAQLKSKDEQIITYRQHYQDLKELTQLLASKSAPPIAIKTEKKSVEGKLVILRLGKGNLKTCFPVTLQIGAERTRPAIECAGELPPTSEILDCYDQWRAAYRRSISIGYRLEVPETQVTNVSRKEFLTQCYESADNLKIKLNLWLNSEQFRPLKEELLTALNTSDSIRFILQADNQLWRFPWHLWDFFERYPKAEIALSTSIYKPVEKTISPQAKVKILAILGNSTGIDIQKDRAMLEQLPDAAVTFLVEPLRQELNDQLWAQPWNILFFAGHSASSAEGQTGQISINPTECLTVSQLKYALQQAITQGLQLAIFNSCDGLGLAANLADLHIPQMIVMREPVPDKVAQEFLKYFLAAFSSGLPLMTSVRQAREKLQGLEDEFPCATWLPVICQNPAEVPLSWHSYLTSVLDTQILPPWQSV